ncbi:MAG: hypothetical protein HC788_10165 [Sphingopyxis sp.]|nr:hypothetical protein [Sphingopyxis sp.]
MISLTFALLLAAPETTAVAPQTAAPAKPQKICRNVERTGTRMSRRKCMTADEWALHDRGDKAKLEMLDQQYKQNVHGSE